MTTLPTIPDEYVFVPAEEVPTYEPMRVGVFPGCGHAVQRITYVHIEVEYGERFSHCVHLPCGCARVSGEKHVQGTVSAAIVTRAMLMGVVDT